MLLNLLNFFEDATTDATQDGGWGMYVIFGVIIVLMIVMMIVPNRKAKKAQQEMESKLGVGVTIMTIGGIVGEIVKIDNEYVWLTTGLGDDKQTMQFTRKAIHSVVTKPIEPTDTNNTEPQDDEVDEIK